MSIFRRHFRVTSGALADECARICAANKDARLAFIPLLEEIGADLYHYWHAGELAGFTFKSAPDENVWRHDRKRDLWLPRKNVPKGKELWKRIQSIPAPQSVQNALKVADLTPNRPALIDGNRWYGPRMGGFPEEGIWFVDVPWREIDPKVMETYLASKEAKTSFDSDMEHLLWVPPAEWEEIKEWQYLKEWEEISGNAPQHN